MKALTRFPISLLPQDANRPNQAGSLATHTPKITSVMLMKLLFQTRIWLSEFRIVRSRAQQFAAPANSTPLNPLSFKWPA
jgi:hypothetical protein